MAASDSKNDPIPLSPTLDAPPSYDAVASSTSEGSSSNPPPFIPSAPPKETLHLFSGPPNAEPILGRSNTPLEVLNSIEEEKKGEWIFSSDRRLGNGEWNSTIFPLQRCFFVLLHVMVIAPAPSQLALLLFLAPGYSTN